MSRIKWEKKDFKGTEYEALPEIGLKSLERYVNEGIDPGSFLRAVLENDLSTSVARADRENRELIPLWAVFVYNKLPSGSVGSPGRVQEWIDHDGMKVFENNTAVKGE